ncbi:DedA family protein [Nocardia africana]|uniref:SNARE associated Golgi protein n=1 Tax=Nocardia africana TaxID=134964 RepID=A0A378WQW2_9NOCA|nr:DedA family protein [Nocardia africana]MCC3314712.1 DedA family protein [Nocardia africana]SUA43005.1 SNARE associated Golgi protein [Nocardia africana]
MTGTWTALNPTSGSSLLANFGALAVLAGTFAESGLLVVGFFLPGDTLIFPAGILCAGRAHSGPHLILWQVLLCAAVGSIAGAQAGYAFGKHGGRAVLHRTSNPRLHTVVARGERWLDRYGARRAIVIGRFVPMVRTVISPVAGVLDVPTRTFTVWQIVGAILWSQSLVLLGYWLGASMPNVDKYLLPAVAVIVVVSLVPLLGQLRKRA